MTLSITLHCDHSSLSTIKLRFLVSTMYFFASSPSFQAHGGLQLSERRGHFNDSKFHIAKKLPTSQSSFVNHNTLAQLCIMRKYSNGGKNNFFF